MKKNIALTRQPKFAGSFYPNDKKKLVKEIEKSFLSELGAQTLNFKRTNQKTKAIIVPHAGYAYSGPCATHGYKVLAESIKPKTYILIGPSHRYPGSSISDEDWETPLGIMKTNMELAKKISNHIKIPINKNQTNEHSLEVQIPFLQYILDKEPVKPEIICIMLHEDTNLALTAKNFSEAIKNENITLIISSDFTHYGKNFDYAPFEDEIQKNIQKLDMGAIQKIKEIKPEAFLEYQKNTGATICGAIPIYFLLLILKLQHQKTESELLKYYTSAKISGAESDSVSYASISFK